MPEGLYQPLIAALKYKGFDSTKLCMFSYLLSSYHPTCSYLRQHSHTSSDQVKTRGRRKESLFFFSNLNQFNNQTHKHSPTNSETEVPTYCKAGRGKGLQSSSSKYRAEHLRLGTGSGSAGSGAAWPCLQVTHTLQVGFHISLCLQGLFLRSLRGRPCAALDLADVLQTDRYLLFKLKYCLNRPYPPRGPHPRLSPFSEC